MLKLENLDVTLGDFIAPAFTVNFQQEWEKLTEEHIETYKLSTVKTIPGAQTNLKQNLTVQTL